MNAMQTDTLPVTLDSEQARQLFGFTRRHMQHLAQTGAVPATKIGSRWVFPTQRLLELAGVAEAKEVKHE